MVWCISSKGVVVWCSVKQRDNFTFTNWESFKMWASGNNTSR